MNVEIWFENYSYTSGVYEVYTPQVYEYCFPRAWPSSLCTWSPLALNRSIVLPPHDSRLESRNPFVVLQLSVSERSKKILISSDLWSLLIKNVMNNMSRL